MPKHRLDCSLYLVTDSTPGILGDRDLVKVVEAAILGGVTVVQYRDKTSDTVTMVNMARDLHSVTKRHRVPLLINDRVDVALAVGCEGVHLGQDDLGMYCTQRIGTALLRSIRPVDCKKASWRGCNYWGECILHPRSHPCLQSRCGLSGNRDHVCHSYKKGYQESHRHGRNQENFGCYRRCWSKRPNCGNRRHHCFFGSTGFLSK